jgi:predicted amidohydrolase
MRVDIAVVQMDCLLGDVAANLAHIEDLAGQAVARLDGLPVADEHEADADGTAAAADETVVAADDRAGERPARLIVFPECATTGYFVGGRAAELAEPADGPTNARLALLAHTLGTHLVVGVLEAEGGAVYDALAVFSPTDGLLASYRKVHLFAGEKAVFAVGNEPCLVDTAFGRVGLTICYDLMFPEYVRGLVLSGAGLIVNGTDWITDPWQTAQGWTGQNVRALCQVRGLENGVHVVMADRVGTEVGFTSLGHSTIAGPTGRVLAALGDGEGIAVARVEDPTEDLEHWRSYATYLADRRTDLYEEMGVGPR